MAWRAVEGDMNLFTYSMYLLGCTSFYNCEKKCNSACLGHACVSVSVRLSDFFVSAVFYGFFVQVGDFDWFLGHLLHNLFNHCGVPVFVFLSKDFGIF